MSEAVASPSHRPVAGAALRLLGDDRLARRAANGDREAFGVLYQRHHQALYRYCRAILGNSEDAADALQNTMTAALRALPGDGRKIRVKPWLYRIAHNESVSLLRRRTPHADLDAAEHLAAPAGSDPETRERLRQLITDLRELQDRQRAALVMRELNGLDYDEIAATLDASLAATKQLVYEARTALHEMAEGRDMSCDSVRRSLSAQDRRMLRGRKLRAHVRACAGCREFKETMEVRRHDIALMAPGLPALAAASLLQGLIGGGHGGAGGGLAGLAGGAAGKVAASSAVAKGVATVAVVATVGAGTAGLTGNLPVPHERNGTPDAGASAPLRSPGGTVAPGATRNRPAVDPRRRVAAGQTDRAGRPQRRGFGPRGARPDGQKLKSRPAATRKRVGSQRPTSGKPIGGKPDAVRGGNARRPSTRVVKRPPVPGKASPPSAEKQDPTRQPLLP